jgi:hypothetical protein
VKYSKKKGSLKSDFYRYIVESKNHLLFKKIEISPQSKSKNKKVITIGESSDIMIRADMKRFFNFNFDSEDIESYLEDIRVDELGVNARLSFYLRVFYIFSIKLKLSSDVSFYKDSANIPMVIHLPVEPEKHLNPSSGIIYSWITNQNYLSLNPGKNLFELNETNYQKIRKGWKTLSQLGKKTCLGSSVCRYRLSMSAEDSGFVMDFKIKKSMVEKGFFPLLVKDVPLYSEKMNWDLDLLPQEKKPITKRIGLYFETSGLKKGSYPWDFWMRYGKGKELPYNCPRPIYVKSTRT